MALEVLARSTEGRVSMLSMFLICPDSNQPRVHKREAVLRKLAPTRAAGFERPYYPDSSFAKVADYVSLGKLSYSIVRRLPSILRAIFIVRKLKYNDDVLYAFSLDTYLLGRLAGFPPGILEVSDLRARGKHNPVIKLIENWVLRDCKAVVLTSLGFATTYDEERLSRGTKVYLIENKMDRKFSGRRPAIEPLGSEKLRIGLIGLLRFKRPIEYLLKAVIESSNLQVVCYGDGPYRHLVENRGNPKIEYYGPFSNPDELERVYKGVDVNFVVYDTRIQNVRVAIPNKLYESIFFTTPILAAEGTQLGEEVSAKGLGECLSIASYKAFQAGLANIDTHWVRKHQLSCAEVPELDVIDDSDIVLAKLLKGFS